MRQRQTLGGKQHFLAILAGFLILFPALCFAQQAFLQSGPMVGAATPNGVKIWVQTADAATVKAVCFTAANPAEKVFSETVTTASPSAFTCVLEFEQLLPNQKYNFQIYLNNHLVVVPYPLQFRTLPLPDSLPELTFALGSCAFTPEPYSNHPDDPTQHRFKIYPAILRQQPDFMLWLGDNVYLWDGDWKTPGGFQYRYARTRSIPQMQPLLGSVHHYAIWDDHDYGPNNANRNWQHKDQSLQTFKQFWANPSYPEKGGISSRFRWADAEFFLTDGRWFRTSAHARKSRREMLGKEQLNWLIDGLKKSTATFKFICLGSQSLSTSRSSENFTKFGRERQELLDAIADANISGVFILDGDRHFTELSRLDRLQDYPLYGFTVSPLTSSATSGGLNRNRVTGTLVSQENFGTIAVSGGKTDRRLTLKVHDADGRVLWQKEIHERELRN